MHYYLYEIKNNLNGKIYVGVHKTANLDDGYMGSGKVIKSAIEKHGIDNFTKVILETFDDSASMYAREAEIVTDEFLAREDVYNLRRGGHGGFDHIVKCGKNINHILTADDRRASGLLNAGKNLKKAHADNKIQYDTFRGRTHSIESRAKMSSTRKLNGSGQGSLNSQYGTTWIWHELVGNRKIQKLLLPEYIDQGWYKMYKPGYVVKNNIP